MLWKLKSKKKRDWKLTIKFREKIIILIYKRGWIIKWIEKSYSYPKL